MNILLIIIGVAAGIVSGMGVGGGAILIPALFLAVRPEQHILQSVNLLYFIPTSVMALIIHIRNRKIDFKIMLPIVVFGLGGAFFGSWLAARLAGNDLKRLFGVFLLIMSVYEMFRKEKTTGKQQS